MPPHSPLSHLRPWKLALPVSASVCKLSVMWRCRLEHTPALLSNDEVLTVLKDRRADRLELGASAHPCEKEVSVHIILQTLQDLA